MDGWILTLRKKIIWSLMECQKSGAGGGAGAGAGSGAGAGRSAVAASVVGESSGAIRLPEPPAKKTKNHCG